MRTKYVILILLLFLLWSCKKNSTIKPAGQQDPIGEKLFNPGDSTGGSFVYGVAKTSDNKIIISGIKNLFNSSVGYMSYYPLRFTVDCNSLKVSSASSPLLNKYGTAAQSKQSGNFIYTLITLTDANGYSLNQAELIKTDTSKNIIWEKTFSTVTNATNLELLANGNLLIEGNYGNDITASSNTLVLLSIDSNGNVIFNKQYTGQFYGSCFDVIEESNDYTLMAFNLRNSSAYSKVHIPALLKIDLNGNVISTAAFNNFFPEKSWHYFTSFHLKKRMQGGYISTSTDVDTSGGVVNENFYLNLINPDGMISKSTNLWINGLPVFRVADVLQTQNGNIYVLVCLDTGTDYVTEIIKYNSQGVYLNSENISRERYPEGIVEAENNNIIVIQNYATANAISILKLDPDLKIL